MSLYQEEELLMHQNKPSKIEPKIVVNSSFLYYHDILKKTGIFPKHIWQRKKFDWAAHDVMIIEDESDSFINFHHHSRSVIEEDKSYDQ